MIAIYRLVDFTVQGDNSFKLKGSENLDLAKELKYESVEVCLTFHRIRVWHKAVLWWRPHTYRDTHTAV